MYDLFETEEAWDRRPACENILRGEPLWEGIDQWLPGMEDL
jgi:hypothetical protein